MADERRTAPIEISEGIADERLDDALRIAYDAFAAKFRIGFRDADDLIRLFRDSVNASACLSAVVDGRLAGILLLHTTEREFFRLRVCALFTRFTPVRAFRMLFNLLLLHEGAKPGVFTVDALAARSSFRGRGVGTTLLERAEELARSQGKATMALGVLGDNDGAIRLYERRGYRTTRVHRGFLVRLATGSPEMRRMEKSIA